MGKRTEATSLAHNTDNHDAKLGSNTLIVSAVGPMAITCLRSFLLLLVVVCMGPRAYFGLAAASSHVISS